MDVPLQSKAKRGPRKIPHCLSEPKKSTNRENLPNHKEEPATSSRAKRKPTQTQNTKTKKIIFGYFFDIYPLFVSNYFSIKSIFYLFVYFLSNKLHFVINHIKNCVFYYFIRNFTFAQHPAQCCLFWA